MSADYRLILEGLCPHHGTPLVRREGRGWCDECRMGYSGSGDSFTLDMEVSDFVMETVELGAIKAAGPVTLIVTRPYDPPT